MSNTLMSYDMLQTIANDPEQHLTEDELKEVDACCQAIVLSDSAAVINYGSDIQKKLSEISERMLVNLNSQDMDDIGEVLNTAALYLRDIDGEKSKFSFFKKKKEKSVREKYKEAEKNVDKVTATLQKHQIQLMKDCAMLTQMYHMNTVYFRDLNVKITAGKRKIDTCKNIELPALEKKAMATGLALDAQALTDMRNQIERFEKKIYELELTRTISLQSAPLIRLLQSNQTTMAEKIQSTLLNTIPLWKNQVVFALSMEHSKQVAETEKKIGDMANNRLLKNVETLNLASIETIQAANRGLIDVSTLEATNKLLIESLDEVARIQQEGKANLSTAEMELAKLDKGTGESA